MGNEPKERSAGESVVEGSCRPSPVRLTLLSPKIRTLLSPTAS